MARKRELSVETGISGTAPGSRQTQPAEFLFALPYKILFETNPHPMWVYDLATLRFVEVNQAALAVYGHTREEFLSRKVVDSHVLEDQEKVLAHLAGLAPSAQTQTRWRHVAKDGRVLHVELAGEGIEYDGKPARMVVLIDYTQTERMHESLEESEARYRALVEHSTEAIVVLDVETGLFADANARACELFGVPLDTLLKSGPSQLSPAYQPNGRPSAEGAGEFIAEALAGGTPVFEWVHIGADGEEVPCEIRLVTLPSREKTLIRCSITDIRGRKRIHEQLERREQEFRSLAENSPDMIVRFNRDLQRIYANAAVAKSNRTPVEELIGKRPTESFPGVRALEEWEAGVALVFETGEPAIVEAKADLMTPGNYLQTHLIPELGSDGKVETVLSITRDLTEVRRAIEESSQLGAIVESSQDGMIIVDLESRIMSWNRGAELIFGFTAAEVIGQSTDMFFEPEEASVRTRIREAVLRSGHSIENLERTWRRKDGRTVTCLSSYFPIRSSNGEVVGIGSVARDVTDLRRAREELVRVAAIVESANDAMMSTDLRGEIVSWNSGAERMFGYSADEAIGRSATDILQIGEELQAEISEPVLVRGETIQLSDRSWPTRGGGSVVASTSFFPLRDSSGATSGLASVARDVGELVRARDELARLAAIVENSSDSITSIDMSGTVTSWNRASEELFGYTADEVIGTHGSVLGGGTSEEVAWISAEIGVGRIVRDLETTRARKDGTLVHVSAATFPLFDSEGRRLGAARVMRDITARKAAEAAVRESEERFRLLADAAPLLIWVSNPQAAIEYFSAGWRNYTGHTHDEDLGSGWVDVLHPDDTQENIDVFTRHTREQTPYSTRYRLRRHDGAYRWMFEYGSPRFDADGTFLGFIGACVDVHETVLAEEALRESETRFRDVVESISAGVWVYDGTDVVMVNTALERISGYGRETLLQPNFFAQLIHEDDVPDIQRRGDARLRGEPVPKTYDIRIWRADGQLRTLEISAAQITFHGRAASLVSAFDITERKQAEQSIIENEARFRNVVEGTPDLITRYDAEIRLEFGNGAALGALARLAGEPLGKHIDEMGLEPAFAALWRKQLELARDGGEQVEFEYETPGSYGNWWRRARIVPEKDETGRTHHLLCVVTDITMVRRAEEERRRLDQQMQQTQKLESLGILAGGIAHDFNNLLVAILGNAGLALMELPKESPARQTVQAIEVAAQRAAELTRQMLAYSGKGKFVIESLNLSKVVEEMAHLLEVSVSKRATLKYRFAADLPAVEGDATQLRQVIMNLITNASDAIGDRNGVVTIATGVMQADLEYFGASYLDADLPDGEYVFVEVSDTGDGMDETTRERIFDPFFTTKFTGRGLGLAAVLGIVRGHRGAIKLYSEVGHGTTFKVLFPAVRTPDAPESKPQPATESSAAYIATETRTVLVVDDDETVRLVTRRMLEHAGFTVLMAGDGVEALSVYGTNPGIDVVLLDMTMPHMDGEETFRELRRMNADVRVVLTSGYNEQDATERFIGKGLAGFIQKPYRPAELRAKIDEVFEE